MTERSVGHDWEDGHVRDTASAYDKQQIFRYESFDSLLSDGDGEAIQRDSLINLAFTRGRVLIQAPAGAGKSTLLAQLATDVGPERQIRIERLGRIRNVRQLLGSYDRAENWLWTVIGGAPTNLLICLDGIDEIPSEIGQRLLIAAEQVSRDAISCGLIITDRPGRRSIRPSRWVIAALRQARLPTTAQSIDEKDASTEWRSLPFYEFLKSKIDETGSRAQMMEKFIRSSTKNKAVVEQIAKVALANRLKTSGSIISFDQLSRGVFDSDIAKLEMSGLVQRVDRRRYEFAHILLHSYLAARDLARRPSAWEKANLSAITFNGANFDALGLLLERLPDSQVDRFVRAVDQWNFYGTLHLLAEDYIGRRRINQSIRQALLLLAGRRRFSDVPSTHIQVEDALRTHAGQLAGAIVAADSVDTLMELSKGLRSDERWWTEWIGIYTREQGAPPRDSDIDALQSTDGLIAWTASNVLLTLHPNGGQRARIMGIARDATDEGARWRAVHVIGSWADEDALDLCIERFRNDPSSWVRNGALRSLILVASRLPTERQREGAFVKLSEFSHELLRNPKWTREIERSVQLRDTPPDWPESVGLLLEELWAESASVEDQDRWRRLSASLRTSWDDAPELGSLL